MDRISGLCDDLLIKILLYVPTKVVVSTSILSKRWEYLWMWLPELDYGNRDYSLSECKTLRCFLDKNLPLHRAPVIESFLLDLSGTNLKPESFKLWVVLALSDCLRELDIIYDSNPEKLDILPGNLYDILPSNLYTCKSLVILKLEGEILLDVPRMVFLPSLKTLQLRRVIYFNEESLHRLLSNCPVLEANYCEDDSMGKLTIVVPSLQRLSLYIPHSNPYIDGIVIDTPCLNYFKLEDNNTESDHD